MKRVSQNAETLKYVDKATQTPICLEAQTQTPGEWQDDGLSLEAAKYLTYVDTSKKDASIEWDSTRQMQAAVDMWMMDYIKRNGVKSYKAYGHRPKVEQFTKEWMSFTGERPHPFVVELFKWARQEHWSRKRPSREEADPDNGANGTSDKCHPGSDDEDEEGQPRQKRRKRTSAAASPTVRDQTDSIPPVLFNYSDPEHQCTYFGGMRRKWTGESKLFKDLLDQRTGTIKKNCSSSMEEMAAKKGEHVWMYKTKVIKGCVQLSEPSGEVCCQGNKFQQQAYYNILLDFTEAWDQPLKMTREGKRQLRSEYQHREAWPKDQRTPTASTEHAASSSTRPEDKAASSSTRPEDKAASSSTRPEDKAASSPREAPQESEHCPERIADQRRPALRLPGPENPTQVLLVFDLDGVLCDRAYRNNAHPHLWDTYDYYQEMFVARRRPFLHELMEFLTANRTHFQAIVWSSAKTQNVKAICDYYFPPDLFAQVMGREDCRKYWLGPEEREKAIAQSPRGIDVAGVHYELTCKDLGVIWDLGIGWNVKNTLLMDDDPKKASLNPLNAIHPCSFDATICKDEHEYDTDCELPRLIEYLTGCRGVEDIQKHVAEIKYEPTRQQAPAPEVNAEVVSGGSSNDPDSGKGMGKGKLKGKGKGKGWGRTKGFFSKGKASWSWQ